MKSWMGTGLFAGVNFFVRRFLNFLLGSGFLLAPSDFLFEVFLGSFEFTQALADAACQLGQTLGTKQEQDDEENENHFSTAGKPEC